MNDAKILPLPQPHGLLCAPNLETTGTMPLVRGGAGCLGPGYCTGAEWEDNNIQKTLIRFVNRDCLQLGWELLDSAG